MSSSPLPATVTVPRRLQRAGGGGDGKPSGDRDGRGSGAQRQAADRADAGEGRCFAGTAWPARNAIGRQRLFQRGEYDGMHGGEHRAAGCDWAAAALSILARAPENPPPVEAMAWRLRTPQGKQLYGLRKQTPEP